MNETQREINNINSKIWRLNNPDKWKAYLDRTRERRSERSRKYQKEHIAELRLKGRMRYRREHGIDPYKVGRANARSDFSNSKSATLVYKKCPKDRREEILTRFAGRPIPDKCELCGCGERQIVFDHCHQTDEFRGWICKRCNTLLGLAHDSTELLTQAIFYLDAHSPDSHIQKMLSS